LQWSHECIPTIQSMLVINGINPLVDCHILDAIVANNKKSQGTFVP